MDELVDLPEDLPPMDTEDGRDEWMDILIEEDEWTCDAMVVRDDDNLVMRIRWPDGSEELYDCIVRRSAEIVDCAPEGEKN